MDATQDFPTVRDASVTKDRKFSFYVVQSKGGNVLTFRSNDGAWIRTIYGVTDVQMTDNERYVFFFTGQR